MAKAGAGPGGRGNSPGTVCLFRGPEHPPAQPSSLCGPRVSVHPFLPSCTDPAPHASLSGFPGPGESLGRLQPAQWGEEFWFQRLGSLPTGAGAPVSPQAAAASPPGRRQRSGLRELMCAAPRGSRLAGPRVYEGRKQRWWLFPGGTGRGPPCADGKGGDAAARNPAPSSHPTWQPAPCPFPGLPPSCWWQFLPGSSWCPPQRQVQVCSRLPCWGQCPLRPARPLPCTAALVRGVWGCGREAEKLEI